VTILFADIVVTSCWRISIPQQSEAILSISVAFVRTIMTYHSPRVTVATGPLGDPDRGRWEDAKAQDSVAETWCQRLMLG
jgi:hypothetical protein